MIALPPVWLLDADGVLNAAYPGWDVPTSREKVAFPSTGRTYTIRWAPPLIDRIRAIVKAGTVEVRWCTTWCAHADELERLWDLPPLGRAFAEPINGMTASRAKHAAAWHVLDQERRLIWTDDHEVPWPDEPYYDELSAGGRALLIRPSVRCGLQPADLDAIEAFADPATRQLDHGDPPSAAYLAAKQALKSKERTDNEGETS